MLQGAAVVGLGRSLLLAGTSSSKHSYPGIVGPSSTNARRALLFCYEFWLDYLLVDSDAQAVIASLAEFVEVAMTVHAPFGFDLQIDPLETMYLTALAAYTHKRSN